MIPNSLFNTLLDIRITLEGYSTETAGVIQSGLFLGMLLGALFEVKVVVVVGHIRAYAAFASILSVTALLHVLMIEPILWTALRMLSGFFWPACRW